MSSPLLQVVHLGVTFHSRDGEHNRAVADVSLNIEAGQVVALVGESGSGKTVTAMSIMGLLPSQGVSVDPASQILFAGQDLRQESAAQRCARRGRDMAMIFQEPMSSLNPVYTVGSQISESLRLHRQMSRRAAWQRSVELLAEVGIPEPEQRARYYPHQLSGGQQQRVMIAMALACEPRLLIADEPTTALDVTVQRQMMTLLGQLQARYGMAILFVTHDLALVREIADQVVVMQSGVIREQGATEAIFTAPQHPYTRALLACRPNLQRRPYHLPVVSDFLNQVAEPTTPAPERLRGSQPEDVVVLEAKNLSKVFRRKVGLWRWHEVPAVQDVSFRLARGRTLGIVGESGSGKTTLGKMVLRLVAASGGEVWFAGRNLLTLPAREFHPCKKQLQIVFQNPYAALNPRFTVARILTEPMQLHGLGADADARLERAVALLQRVGLPTDALRRYPHEFSGGQRQRISIARCLALEPQILVCDESVSALDVSVQAQVLNLLTELQDDLGLSYLFISHDLAVIRHMADDVLVMQQGRVVEQGPVDAIYADPQQDYTRMLLAAIPGRGIQLPSPV